MLSQAIAQIGIEWAAAQGLLLTSVDALVALQTQWGAALGAAMLFAVLTLWSSTGIPGCSVLILAIGVLYGWWWGTVLVSVASTLGATMAFAAARWGLRSSLRQRHAAQLAQIDRLLVQRGPWVLVLLRMAPVIPFPLLNPLMGLTTMRTLPFFIWSYLGMLGGTVVWVLLGQGIGQLGLRAWAEPRLWVALAVLAVATLWATRVARRWQLLAPAVPLAVETAR